MKSPGETISPLLGPLAAVQRLLARYPARSVIIGGVAASLLGKPRLTADVDALLLIGDDELSDLLRAAREEGLVPRLDAAEAFARRFRVVLLRHEETGIGIDITLGMLPFEEEVVARGVERSVAELPVRLPTPEDLVILKAVAHRPKDLLDIQGILASHPDLDRDRVERWVRDFARLLEMPEIWEDIADWLK